MHIILLAAAAVRSEFIVLFRRIFVQKTGELEYKTWLRSEGYVYFIIKKNTNGRAGDERNDSRAAANTAFFSSQN